MRCLVLVLAACATTASPPPASPGAGPVAGTLAELNYFVGAWRAEIRDPSTGKVLEMMYRIEPVLRGVWYQGSGSVAGLDLEIHDLWGKDRETGEVVRTIFDSQGTFGTVRSKGWVGDALVFEGSAVAGGAQTALRETIHRIGPDEFHALWESRDGETWTAYSDETLRRTR